MREQSGRPPRCASISIDALPRGRRSGGRDAALNRLCRRRFTATTPMKADRPDGARLQAGRTADRPSDAAPVQTHRGAKTDPPEARTGASAHWPRATAARAATEVGGMPPNAVRLRPFGWTQPARPAARYGHRGNRRRGEPNATPAAARRPAGRAHLRSRCAATRMMCSWPSGRTCRWAISPRFRSAQGRGEADRLGDLFAWLHCRTPRHETGPVLTKGVIVPVAGGGNNRSTGSPNPAPASPRAAIDGGLTARRRLSRSLQGLGRKGSLLQPPATPRRKGPPSGRGGLCMRCGGQWIQARVFSARQRPVTTSAASPISSMSAQGRNGRDEGAQ